MNEILNWNDARLFLAVARAGGLSGAVAQTSVSAPTLCRRMLTLERSLGITLFVRRRNGYLLTSDGEELLKLSEAMERSALGIERWRTETDPHPVVKIAAGAWTSTFLSRHLLELLGPDDVFSIDILTGIAPQDLMRREANLGLRNQQPTSVGLAGKRLVRVEFAIYGEEHLVKKLQTPLLEKRFDDCTWVMFSPNDQKIPSSVWLDQRLEREPKVRCSNANIAMEATLAGVGLCILPCFIGDTERKLVRACEPIIELGHHQWLVSHDDDRHNQEIRLVSKRIKRLIQANKSLFGGAISGF